MLLPHTSTLFPYTTLFRSPRHGPRADGLDARGLERIEDLARNLALWRVARIDVGIVKALAERISIGRAPREQDFLARHPAADLRQPHAGIGAPRRIRRKGDLQLLIAGQRPRRLATSLLERLGGVVTFLCHIIRQCPADAANLI